MSTDDHESLRLNCGCCSDVTLGCDIKGSEFHGMFHQEIIAAIDFPIGKIHYYKIGWYEVGQEEYDSWMKR